ncbi:Transcriptional regulator, TetR family [Alloactinosynnema sp. L-07]|uniref:QsdR family transcriptional regulator n=1 Tax=Alloactinosynnema sp. L-07 TaxID=1653480 RepID=UPI00065F0736|nr:QsdR family transcriptional regulator [Alloactinosynnema sp. L-07]CRK56535.1 Transcriptional regulator, TetR family [Alloactinosynnema sp. L-07]
MKTTSAARRPVGRPAAATREQVLTAARTAFVEGRRIEVRAIAAEFGASRATMYRWFGSREGLLAEVVLGEMAALFDRADRRARGRGADRVLDTLESVNRRLIDSPPLRSFLALEPSGLQILTSSSGRVQPGVVGIAAAYLDRVATEDDFRPPIELTTLAYAIVRLSEAFVHDDSPAGMRHEIGRLREIHAALLGVSQKD